MNGQRKVKHDLKKICNLQNCTGKLPDGIHHLSSTTTFTLAVMILKCYTDQISVCQVQPTIFLYDIRCGIHTIL